MFVHETIMFGQVPYIVPWVPEGFVKVGLWAERDRGFSADNIPRVNIKKISFFYYTFCHRQTSVLYCFTWTTTWRKLLYQKEMSTEAAINQPNETSTGKLLPGTQQLRKTKKVYFKLVWQQSAFQRRVCVYHQWNQCVLECLDKGSWDYTKKVFWTETRLPSWTA